MKLWNLHFDNFVANFWNLHNFLHPPDVRHNNWRMVSYSRLGGAMERESVRSGGMGERECVERKESEGRGAEGKRRGARGR